MKYRIEIGIDEDAGTDKVLVAGLLIQTLARHLMEDHAEVDAAMIVENPPDRVDDGVRTWVMAEANRSDGEAVGLRMTLVAEKFDDSGWKMEAPMSERLTNILTGETHKMDTPSRH